MPPAAGQKQSAVHPWEAGEVRAVLVMALIAQPTLAGEARGRLDRALISKAISARMGEVQRCAEASLTRRPGVLPKVVVRFTIGLRGQVTSAEVDGQAPEDKAYGECLVDVVQRVKTPPPQGGPVVVRYPFIVCGTGF